MKRLIRILQPRRSVAVAVGWLAALLSLAIAAISIGLGNAAREHLDRQA